jgi:hypothetical protein
MEKLIVTQLIRKFSAVMEPKYLFMCLEEPAASPLAEPDESSPYPQTPFP